MQYRFYKTYWMLFVLFIFIPAVGFEPTLEEF